MSKLEKAAAKRARKAARGPGFAKVRPAADPRKWTAMKVVRAHLQKERREAQERLRDDAKKLAAAPRETVKAG